MMVQGMAQGVQQGGMMVAQAVNQAGMMPYGGQVAPAPVMQQPVADPYNQLVGYAYPQHEAMNYVRMLDGTLNPTLLQLCPFQRPCSCRLPAFRN